MKIKSYLVIRCIVGGENAIVITIIPNIEEITTEAGSRTLLHTSAQPDKHEREYY